ncbi:MAG: histidine kinase dimerization/phospho-acceptor domain-containing protein [Patescibacteria group bacterium]|nr:histidine kinase dimerization/phospho-acceptor domain-containing protein [Patescibacteria group bacterium]
MKNDTGVSEHEEIFSKLRHDLSTPISTIKWFTEILLAKDTGELNTNQKKCVDEICKANKKMLGMVRSRLGGKT